MGFNSGFKGLMNIMAMYVRMHACMYVCMHACMHACMHVCMYACSMHVCIIYVCLP